MFPQQLEATSPSGLRLSRLTSVVLFLLTVPSLAAAQEFKLIVHPETRVESLPAERVSAFFLKKVIQWESGASVLPVDQTADASVRESFSQKVHGKSLSAIKGYWQRKIFSGKDVPPPQKSSDEEVLAYVSSHPGAIGYVSADAPASGVKVVVLTP